MNQTLTPAQLERLNKRDGDGKFSAYDRGAAANDLDLDADSTRDLAAFADEPASSPLAVFDMSAVGKRYSEVDKGKRVEAMKNDLREAVAAAVASGRIGEFMETMARNRLGNWSFQNKFLALAQLAAVRGELAEDDPHKNAEPMVMSAAAWKREYGAFPKKGSKAIWILSPAVVKATDGDGNVLRDDRTGENLTRLVGFRSQAEFDISQVQGDNLPEARLFDDLPDLPAPPGAAKGLQDRIEKLGYSFSERRIAGANPLTGMGTLAYADPKSKQVVVDERCTPAQKVQTMAHELAHIQLGHVDDLDAYRAHRGQMETEAEATAYMVARALGVQREQSDAFTPAYIGSWSDGDPAVVEKALTKATKAFNEIIDGVWPDSD